MKYIYNDGGRALSGYKGSTGDCVCRAIAIATSKPYQEVYDELISCKESFRQSKRVRGSHPRTGVNKKVYHRYLDSLGWKWIPTMKIGSGCKVHLDEKELPRGTVILRLSGHLVTIIDGVIHDSGNPQWVTVNSNGTSALRCVYGYFVKK